MLYGANICINIGSETVDFEPMVPLEGKVETYLQTVLTAQMEQMA